MWKTLHKLEFVLIELHGLELDINTTYWTLMVSISLLIVLSLGLTNVPRVFIGKYHSYHSVW